MHEKLRTHYNTYVSRYIDDAIKKENDIEEDSQRLIMPGEDEDYSKMFEINTKKAKNADDEMKDESAQPRTRNQNFIADDLGHNESQCNIVDDTNESFSERKHKDP